MRATSISNENEAASFGVCRPDPLPDALAGDKELLRDFVCVIFVGFGLFLYAQTHCSIFRCDGLRYDHTDIVEIHVIK
jgi:hypothetical protein